MMWVFVVLTLWPPAYLQRGDSGCTGRQLLQLGPPRSKEVETMVDSFTHQESDWLHSSAGGLGVQSELQFIEGDKE